VCGWILLYRLYVCVLWCVCVRACVCVDVLFVCC
jgi:hypothetical protein